MLDTTLLRRVSSLALSENERRGPGGGSAHARGPPAEPTATRIWDLLEHPSTPAALLAVLREEFEAPDEALRADIRTLLAELGAKGLVGPEAGADDHDGDGEGGEGDARRRGGREAEMIPRQGRCGDDEVVGMEPAAAIIHGFQGWAHDNLVPLNVSLEITLACNIRCVHCYNFDRDLPLPGRAASCERPHRHQQIPARSRLPRPRLVRAAALPRRSYPRRSC